MGQRWLTRPGDPPRAALAAVAALALAAAGQAVSQAVALSFASSGAGVSAGAGVSLSLSHRPGLLAFLYAVPLCGLALLSTLPLLFLRPAGAAVLTAGASALALALFPAPTVAGALGTVIAAGRLGAAGEIRSVAGRPAGRAAAQYLAVGLAAPFLALALARPGNVAGVLLAAAVPMAAGAGVALRADRVARTYSEAGQALADTLVAHTARGERARIARELHDVVAHHISMIAVQAETGRLTTPGLPEAGARRFAEIGDTARAGLTEMRRLLGVLREDAAAAAEGGASGATRAGAGTGPGRDAGPAGGAGADPGSGPGAGPASRQPQPGLVQLAELIDAARDASVAGTRLIISGPVAPLDPGVELAAYRIVQEALTNTRRHAPGAAVDVELRYGADTLRLRVRDNGPGPSGVPAGPGPLAGQTGVSGSGTGESGAGEAAAGRAAADSTGAGAAGPAGSRQAGAGHGLLGMRERAFSVGGSLYTGMAPGGGFLVEAVFPAEPDQAPRPRAAAEASR